MLPKKSAKVIVQERCGLASVESVTGRLSWQMGLAVCFKAVYSGEERGMTRFALCKK